MPMYGQRDSLDWLSLFSISSEKEKKQKLTHLREYSLPYDVQRLASAMTDGQYNRYDEPCFQKACEHVALKFMLCDSDMARDLLDAEELSKANELYKRGQNNSKLLQRLLQYFSCLLSSCSEEKRPKHLFTIALHDALHAVQEEEIGRALGTLKKTIEKVAAGVKPGCYLAAEQAHFLSDHPLCEELNNFFKEQTGYDFNRIHDRNSLDINKRSSLFGEHGVCNRILQFSLVNDPEFWRDHPFIVTVFLNEIVKQNDLRHAQKVLSHILQGLQTIPHMDVVLQHRLPLYASLRDDLAKGFENQAHRYAFTRLTPYCDLSPLSDATLCYPMNSADERKFTVGQSVWKRFLCEYNYPHRHEEVCTYLCREVERFVASEDSERKDDDIAVILDIAPFCYFAHSEDRQLFEAYHPDGFSCENIWKRVYLTAYCVTLLSNDEQMQCAFLQRIFIDLIKTIETRLGIATKHQLDTSSRDRQYDALKTKLASYGLAIRDEHKTDYIVSLLDRDTALQTEAMRFPALEQDGDAIYGLAVAELLFYNPNTENMMMNFEKFTRAEAQLAISKKHGFDTFYLQIGIPNKYIEQESMFYDFEITAIKNIDEAIREKYLADSLEMIIGAIYRDLGAEQALSFTKQLLCSTFPEYFGLEIHPTFEHRNDASIERDYWTKILPAPCSTLTPELRTLWNALNKVLLVVSLGTNDKKTRMHISHSLGYNEAMYGEENNHGVTWAFHDYLNNGLASVVKNYSSILRENYKKRNGI